ncbi:MAG: stage II sporulation protein P [Clostridia bacterium]|nr:stage II sporulation protein P [Clostridia bacterium]
MLKRIILLTSIIYFAIFNFGFSYNTNSNELFNSEIEMYSVYDEDFKLLFQKDIVAVGDGYLSDDNKYYEVVYVDEDTKNGLAKFVREVKLPEVDFSSGPIPIKIERRVICMYMTHNDESYVPSDGVDSVYGNGGIRDVAIALKSALEKHFVNVYFNDALHIPHDTKAYSRSMVTAKSLNDTYKPDALFDIHRDATSRSFYVTKVNGRERGRVRMVIGKANPNMSVNEEFALYLMAVAKEMYPWLFTDIYYASGHYNQELDGKAILFEMGSHLVEKELEMESMTELADVITTALYNTTINENTGDLTINGVENSENKTVNKYIDDIEKDKVSVLAVCIGVTIFAAVASYAIYVFFKNFKKSQLNNTNKNSKNN